MAARWSGTGAAASWNRAARRAMIGVRGDRGTLPPASRAAEHGSLKKKILCH